MIFFSFCVFFEQFPVEFILPLYDSSFVFVFLTLRIVLLTGYAFFEFLCSYPIVIAKIAWFS